MLYRTLSHKEGRYKISVKHYKQMKSCLSGRFQNQQRVKKHHAADKFLAGPSWILFYFFLLHFTGVCYLCLVGKHYSSLGTLKREWLK